MSARRSLRVWSLPFGAANGFRCSKKPARAKKRSMSFARRFTCWTRSWIPWPVSKHRYRTWKLIEFLHRNSIKKVLATEELQIHRNVSQLLRYFRPRRPADHAHRTDG